MSRSLSSRLRAPLLSAAAAALVFTTTIALAGSGVGGVFNLGLANTVDATSSLSGDPGANPELRVTNTGASGAAIRGDAQAGTGVTGNSISGTGQAGQSQSGIGLSGIHSATTGTNPGVQGTTNSTAPTAAGVLGKNMGGGPGLSAMVKAGAPPLAVNSTRKVANLNADLFDGLDSSRLWKLGGNPGTTPGTDFIGTSDNTALELKVNGQRALRIEPNGDSPNLIGGSAANGIGLGVSGATIGGGGGAPGTENKVTGGLGTVGGGWQNTAGGSAAVAGGQGNAASGDYSTVTGGFFNAASDHTSAVAGGEHNTASGPWASVGGGDHNTASVDGSAVGGGSNNQASSVYATIGGGGLNDAAGLYSTVAGGGENSAGNDYSTVGGGSGNQASGEYAFVGGGRDNMAGALDDTVAGGLGNRATGGFSTVPGGFFSAASGFMSFAAGVRAKATHFGSFVWGDSNDFDIGSNGTNTFTVRATGGARFVSGIDVNGTPNAGVQLAAGGGSWSSLSDRRAKEGFRAVDKQALLRRLARISIDRWSYKAQGPLIVHMGPTAQDFARAFGLGEDNRHITAVDADGVALAAIQGLLVQKKALDRKVDRLKRQNESLNARLKAQNSRLTRLEHAFAAQAR